MFKFGICSFCLLCSYSQFILYLFFLIRKYIAIVSYEQRQNYKDDFNAEYDEYRALHARMETVARRFIKLDAQRKRLSPGSKEYQVNASVPKWTEFSYFSFILSLPCPSPGILLAFRERLLADQLLSSFGFHLKLTRKLNILK